MIRTRLKEFLLLDSFWQHPKCPLKIVAHTKGGNSSLILGESLSGKSFLLRRMHKLFQPRVSTNLYAPTWDDATMSDDARFNSFRRVAPELHSYQSNMLESCLNTAQEVSRAIHNHLLSRTPGLLLVDDPCRGLSHDHTCALARYYANRMRLADTGEVDLVIATNSRTFAKIVFDNADRTNLSTIMTGSYVRPLEWLNGLGVMSEEDLLSIPIEGRMVRKKIDEVLAIEDESFNSDKRLA